MLANSKLFLISLCFGLLSGLAEGSVYWILSVHADGFGWKNDLLPEILWIAPLVNVMGFLLLALLVVLIRRVLPQLAKDFFAYAAFGYAALYGPLSASGKFNQI